jgi:hypothetical protein
MGGGPLERGAALLHGRVYVNFLTDEGMDRMMAADGRENTRALWP